jgi:hypothetical protein
MFIYLVHREKKYEERGMKGDVRQQNYIDAGRGGGEVL